MTKQERIETLEIELKFYKELSACYKEIAKFWLAECNYGKGN